MHAIDELEKPFAVRIVKPDGVREVEFNRYAQMKDAEAAAHALRRHGINAHTTGPNSGHDERSVETR